VQRYSGPERRTANRPKSGDLDRCPRCGGMLRFEERVAITHRDLTEQKPAWLCRNVACSYEYYVREKDRRDA
jgi:hypothetical protein